MTLVRTALVRIALVRMAFVRMVLVRMALGQMALGRMAGGPKMSIAAGYKRPITGSACFCFVTAAAELCKHI
jgi:hypothetical protein